MRSVKAFPLNQELATTATWLATFSVIAPRSALVLASAAERLATWRVTARTLTAVWMTASATTAVAWATCLGTAPRATAPATGERGVSVGVCGRRVNLNSDQPSCVGSEWIWTVTSPAVWAVSEFEQWPAQLCGQCVNLNSDQHSCVGIKWIWTVICPAV